MENEYMESCWSLLLVITGNADYFCSKATVTKVISDIKILSLPVCHVVLSFAWHCFFAPSFSLLFMKSLPIPLLKGTLITPCTVLYFIDLLHLWSKYWFTLLLYHNVMLSHACASVIGQQSKHQHSGSKNKGALVWVLVLTGMIHCTVYQ